MNTVIGMRTAVLVLLAALVGFGTMAASPAHGEPPPWNDHEQCEVLQLVLAAALGEWDPFANDCDSPGQQTYLPSESVTPEGWPVYTARAEVQDVCVFGDGTDAPDLYVDFLLGHFGPVDIDKHPEPGNVLYGQSVRMTIHSYDVDRIPGVSDWMETLDPDISIFPKLERDNVAWYDSFGNKTAAVGHLSGFHDRHMTTEFAFPASALRTAAAEDTHMINKLGIDVDALHNRTDVRAVKRVFCVAVNQVDLILEPTFVPAVLVHGWNSDIGGLFDLDIYLRGQVGLDLEQVNRADYGANTSYKDRYDDIVEAVNDLKTDNNVDKVNIIAHSHGGLAARYYASQHPENVNMVYMIATPNNGSSLANMACSKNPLDALRRARLKEAIATSAVIQSLNLDCPSNSAMNDLRPKNVDKLNRDHPDQRSVLYGIVAGTSGSGGYYDGTSKLVQSPNDGMVPVESALWLRSGEVNEGDVSLPVASPDGLYRLHEVLMIRHKNHSELKSDSLVLADIGCRLYGYCLQPLELEKEPDANQLAQTSEPRPDTWSYDAIVTVPANDSLQVPLEFESTDWAYLTVVSEGIEDISSAFDSETMTSAVLIEDVELLELLLESPDDGNLTLTNSSNDPIDVLVQLTIETDRRLQLEVEHVLPIVGEESDVTLTLSDPETTQAATLYIVDPEGEVEEQEALGSSSTGEWFFGWTPAMPGLYELAAHSEGDTERQVFQTLFVAPPDYDIVEVTDVDLANVNHDGYEDEVRVTVEVEIDDAGDYILSAVIADDTDTPVASAASVEQTLAAGTHELELVFSGESIRGLASGGPLQLVEGYLSQSIVGGYLPVAYAAVVDTDLGVNIAELQPPPPVLDPESFDDEGLDEDENEILEGILFTGDFFAPIDGDYTVQATLRDSAGSYITTGFWSDEVDAGVNQFEMVFEADVIIRSGAAGPFHVTFVTVSIDQGGPRSYEWETYVTASYTRGDFGVSETIETAATLGSPKSFSSGTEGHLTFIPISISAEGEITIEVTTDTEDGFLWLRDPSGATLFVSRLAEGTHFMRDLPLDLTGEYVFVFESLDSSSETVVLTARSAPAPVEVEADANDPDSAETTQPGQLLIIEFEAEEGQYALTLDSEDVLTGRIYVIRPDSGGMESIDFDDGAASTPFVQIWSSGTAYFVVVPDGPEFGDIDFEVVLDTSVTIEVDGDPTTVVTTNPGQEVTGVFDVEQATPYKFRLEATSTASGMIYVDDPYGFTLQSSAFSSGTATEINLSRRLRDEAHTVRIVPSGSVTDTYEMSVVTTGNDLVYFIDADGTVHPLTTTSGGQAVRLRFACEEAQFISSQLTSTPVTGGSMKLYRNDGVTTTYINSSGGSNGPVEVTLGDYCTLLVEPSSGQYGLMNISVHTVVDSVQSITPNGSPVVVSLTAPGQDGYLEWTASPGDRIKVSGTSSSISSGVLRLLRPDGSTQTSASITTSGANISSYQTLTESGTYRLQIDPNGGVTGSITISLIQAPPDVTGTITPGGSSEVITIGSVEQEARYTFSGTADDRVSLQVTSSSISSMTVRLLRPDGSIQKSQFVSGASGFMDTETLATTGTYTLLVQPTGSATGSATFQLHSVPSNAMGSITPGGSSVSPTISTPGQNAEYTFSGTEDDRVSLSVSASTVGAGNLRILKPDGTALGSAFVSSATGFLDALTLPETGTYRAVLDPNGAGVGSATMQLFDVPSDSFGSITPGGSSVSPTITTPGQNAEYTFSGTSGDRVSVEVTGSTIGGGVYIRVYRPSGAQLGAAFMTGSSGFLDTLELPDTGTYRLVVDPSGTNTGSATVAAFDVPGDDFGSITPGGSSVSPTVTTPGQNPTYTFSATAGDRVSIQVTGSTVGATYLRLIRPNGTTQSTKFYSAATSFMDVQELGVSGTWKVVVDASGTNTGSATIQLYDVPADASGSITVGGSSENVSIGTPGQNATLTFTGSASNKVSIQLSSVTIGSSPTYSARVSVKKPDGSNLLSPTIFGTNGKTVQVTLPTTGTYTILIDPNDEATGGATVTAVLVP